MDSILTSIKKLLGIDASYDVFDPDIVMHINSIFMILNQLGVGPATPFTISNANAVWSDFMPDGERLELVKSYMALRVKALFDPSQNSSVAEAQKNAANEFEWRLMVAADPKLEV